MHSWYKGRTVASIVHAIREVREYKRAKREYLRWLRAGKVVVTLAPDKDALSWPIITTKAAILTGVELVVFSPRRLLGMDNERKDDFWKMDWSVETPDPSKFDQEYFQRYHGFERYDKYHGIGGGAALVGGIGMFVEDSIHMMREVLARPYSMTIENRSGEPLARDASKCILKGVDGPQLDLGNNAWGFSISYE